MHVYVCVYAWLWCVSVVALLPPPPLWYSFFVFFCSSAQQSVMAIVPLPHYEFFFGNFFDYRNCYCLLSLKPLNPLLLCFTTVACLPEIAAPHWPCCITINVPIHWQYQECHLLIHLSNAFIKKRGKGYQMLLATWSCSWTLALLHNSVPIHVCIRNAIHLCNSFSHKKFGEWKLRIILEMRCALSKVKKNNFCKEFIPTKTWKKWVFVPVTFKSA